MSIDVRKARNELFLINRSKGHARIFLRIKDLNISNKVNILQVIYTHFNKKDCKKEIPMKAIFGIAHFIMSQRHQNKANNTNG